MNKIFITGSTGFVGTNLVAYLTDHQQKVVGVSRIKNSKTNTIDYLDFGEQSKLKAKAIVHLAGKAHDLTKAINREAYFEANYGLTKAVFQTFLKSEATTFIYMSSVKAVHDVVEDILTEEEIPSPITAYGQSKRKAEEFILSQSLPERKRVYILRPCIIHGPGNKGNLNLLYQLVSKRLPWILGAFDNKRSFLSINNLCFVINELIENGSIPSGIYQVADDKPLSTNELIELLGISMHKKSKILKVPTFCIKAIAQIGNYLPLPINSDRLQKLTDNYVVSNAKILSAIGKPLPVSSKEGLLKTFASFEKQ